MKPEYYDFFSDEKIRLQREAPLLKEIALNSPALKFGILDATCGTGMQAYFFANLGYKVIARDINSESLKWAQIKRSHPLITYEKMDMRNSEAQKFGLIITMGNSLSLLPDFESLKKTFQAFQKQLVLGGKILIQILDYESLSKEGKSSMLKMGEISGHPLVITKTMFYFAGDYVVSFNILEKLPKTDWAGSSYVFRLNPWSAEDIIHAAKNAGLTIEAEFSSYEKMSFTRGKGIDYLAIFKKL